jgi:hypothetical protein
MGQKLTAQDGKIALRDHVALKAADAHNRLSKLTGDDAIWRLLNDSAVVRYPVGVRFDAGPLEPGEFAFPSPLGEHPSQGFCLFIHPRFEHRPETWPLIAGYYLPSINYGDIATEDDAELFGAVLVGMNTEEYHAALCVIADEVAP